MRNQNPQTAETPGSEGLTGKFYLIFKEELTSIFLKIFQNIEGEGILP